MKTIIGTQEEIFAKLAQRYAALLSQKPEAVLGFTAVDVPAAAFDALAANGVSFAKATAFNACEYVGEAAQGAQSQRAILQKLLYEFPVKEIAVTMPAWVTMLEHGHWLQSAVYTAMLDYADPALRARGFAPYYLYRQKYMSGSFENVGWCISGAEGLYNIYIMEELHSILSLGAGGSTKMVDAGRNRIERVFHPKFPLEYIQRPEKLTENLEAFRRFHENMAR